MKPTPSPTNSVAAEVDSPVAGDFGLAGGEVRRRQIVFKAFAVGLVAGLLGAGFRVALEWSESLRTRSIHSLPGWRGALFAVAIGSVGAGSATWFVQRLAPHARGSGIPWLKSVLLGEQHPEWRRLLPVKFLAGLIGIGSGLALGREGPTVQMGGAAGAMVGRLLGVQNEQERRALISAGAGAGLAAGFNAPLSGLIFVLEELHGSFTPVVFVAAFLASVTGDVVTRLLVSERPVFHMNVAAPGVGALPWAAGLGVLCGVAGVVFNSATLSGLDFVKRTRLPGFVVAAFIGAVVGLCGWWQPGMAGSGGALVEATLAGRFALAAVPLFVLMRFALSIGSYSTGSAGGVFAPLLVLGALGGWSFGVMAQRMSGGAITNPAVFCVLGMGALFSGIVRAPLTGIVLMLELTGDYDFVLPLLVSCLSAYGVAEWLKSPPLYDALRRRDRAGSAVSPTDQQSHASS